MNEHTVLPREHSMTHTAPTTNTNAPNRKATMTDAILAVFDVLNARQVTVLIVCIVLLMAPVQARPRISNSVLRHDRQQIHKLHSLKHKLDEQLAETTLADDESTVYEVAPTDENTQHHMRHNHRREPTARFVDDRHQIVMQVHADVVETPPSPTMSSSAQQRSAGNYDERRHATYSTSKLLSYSNLLCTISSPGSIRSLSA